MGKWMSAFTPEAPPSRTPVASPCWASSSSKIPRCLDSLPPVAPPGPRSPHRPGRLVLWASGGIQPLTEAAVTVGPVLSRPQPCRCSPKVCTAALGVAWMVGFALPPSGSPPGARAPAEQALGLHSPSTKDWPVPPTSRPAFCRPPSCRPRSVHPAPWAGRTQPSLASPRLPRAGQNTVPRAHGSAEPSRAGSSQRLPNVRVLSAACGRPGHPGLASSPSRQPSLGTAPGTLSPCSCPGLISKLRPRPGTGGCLAMACHRALPSSRLMHRPFFLVGPLSCSEQFRKSLSWSELFPGGVPDAGQAPGVSSRFWVPLRGPSPSHEPYCFLGF